MCGSVKNRHHRHRGQAGQDSDQGHADPQPGADPDHHQTGAPDRRQCAGGQGPDGGPGAEAAQGPAEGGRPAQVVASEYGEADGGGTGEGQVEGRGRGQEDAQRDRGPDVGDPGTQVAQKVPPAGEAGERGGAVANRE